MDSKSKISVRRRSRTSARSQAGQGAEGRGHGEHARTARAWLGPYLRRVVPAVWRELRTAGPQPLAFPVDAELTRPLR